MKVVHKHCRSMLRTGVTLMHDGRTQPWLQVGSCIMFFICCAVANNIVTRKGCRTVVPSEHVSAHRQSNERDDVG